MSDQKRILVFVHDGRGLGHLRRLSRIAARLQGPCSVLFVTGHRSAAYMVPASCEYIHIPSLDSIDPRRARQWGRDSFLSQDPKRGRAIRSSVLMACVDNFRPHALLTDYLPLGIDHELLPLLERTPDVRKYFVVRGILGDPRSIYQTIFTEPSLDSLRRHYDMILATCDEAVVDIGTEYALEPDLVQKLAYTGYAVEPFDPKAAAAVRRERKLPDDARWVVCTAGGGKDGEDLMRRCWELAMSFPECHFDLVLGPRSRISLLEEGWYGGSRIRVRQADYSNMPALLGAADVVICRGGYNSLMEALVGPARIIVAPIIADYEQVHHARRLSAFRSIEVVDDIGNLDTAFEAVLCKSVEKRDLSRLNLTGLSTTARLILADLASSRSSFSPDEEQTVEALAGIHRT